jgi:hypothetical protein
MRLCEGYRPSRFQPGEPRLELSALPRLRVALNQARHLFGLIVPLQRRLRL